MGIFDDLFNLNENNFTPGAPEDGQSLIIEELEGQKRKIELTKRAMPYSEVEFGINQRVSTTYYQGSQVATQQVLGPEFPQFTLEGKWKDLYIKNAIKITNSNTGFTGEKIESAEQAIRLFETICETSVSLKVQYLSQLRFCRLVSFVATYDNATDIAWKATFEPYSRSNKIQARNSESFESATAGFSLWGALEDLLASLAAFIDAINSFVQGIFAAINKLRSIVKALFDLVQLAETLINLPGNILGAIKSLVKDLVSGLTALLKLLVGTKAGATGTGNLVLQDAVSADGSKVSAGNQKVKFEQKRKDAAVECARLRVYAIDVSKALEKRFRPDIVKIVTSKAGQTVYDIAQEVFGDASLGDYIASVNNFSVGQLQAGTKVNIPEKITGSPQFTSLTKSKVC